MTHENMSDNHVYKLYPVSVMQKQTEKMEEHIIMGKTYKIKSYVQSKKE